MVQEIIIYIENEQVYADPLRWKRSKMGTQILAKTCSGNLLFTSFGSHDTKKSIGIPIIIYWWTKKKNYHEKDTQIIQNTSRG